MATVKEERIVSIRAIHTHQDSGVVDIQVSGGESFALNGIYVHNSYVERGTPEFQYTGTQEVRIKPHQRRIANGTVVDVGEHVRRYVDKSLIGFRPGNASGTIFRVMKGQKARPGKFFLTRAVLRGIQDLPKDIEFYMKRLAGGGVV